MEVATGANPYTPVGRSRIGEREAAPTPLGFHDLVDAKDEGRNLGDYIYTPVESSPETGEPSGEMTLDPEFGRGTPITVEYHGRPHDIYNLSDTEIVLIDPKDNKTFGVNWDEIDNRNW